MVSVQFQKRFKGPLFCDAAAEKLQIFTRYFFSVATSTARKFNNSRPLYLKFSNIINLSQIFDSVEIAIPVTFILEKESPKNTNFSFFLKEPLFRNGWLFSHECWRLVRDFCGLPKRCSFTTIPKI